ELGHLLHPGQELVHGAGVVPHTQIEPVGGGHPDGRGAPDPQLLDSFEHGLWIPDLQVPLLPGQAGLVQDDHVIFVPADALGRHRLTSGRSYRSRAMLRFSSHSTSPTAPCLALEGEGAPPGGAASAFPTGSGAGPPPPRCGRAPCSPPAAPGRTGGGPPRRTPPRAGAGRPPPPPGPRRGRGRPPPPPRPPPGAPGEPPPPRPGRCSRRRR